MRKETFKELLTPAERNVFRKLNSPAKIQDFLDTMPINFELHGETYMSPRRVLRARTAHCFEGALLAAAALAYHGRRPLILDLRTVVGDEDHVIALFKDGKYWGAISKTNHPILRYRDAVYESPRELAMSYFHEYVMSKNGKKTLREYSKPFDLSRYKPSSWVVAEEELYWLVQALDDALHLKIASKIAVRKLRIASALEIKAMDEKEWKPPKKRRR
jgi:hypothetical protein